MVKSMNRKLLSMMIIVLASSIGCGVKPDEVSGGDAERHHAKPLALNKADGDSVNYAEGDRTDWKVVELQDTGSMKIEVILDNPNANVVTSLYDRYGKAITRTTHRKGDGALMTMASDVGLGKYFIMVQAEGRPDKTGYTIKAVIK